MNEHLSKALHAERAEKNTRNVDCWACEAAHSPAIQALLARVQKAEAAASHIHAVFVAAVPDEEQQMALWRDHWRAQLAARRPAPVSAHEGSEQR